LRTYQKEWQYFQSKLFIRLCLLSATKWIFSDLWQGNKWKKRNNLHKVYRWLILKDLQWQSPGSTVWQLSCLVRDCPLGWWECVCVFDMIDVIDVIEEDPQHLCVCVFQIWFGYLKEGKNQEINVKWSINQPKWL
jgi:hypothetical protein